jgi:hypothetical protein
MLAAGIIPGWRQNTHTTTVRLTTAGASAISSATPTGPPPISDWIPSGSAVMNGRPAGEADGIQAFFADKAPSDYYRYTIAGELFEEKNFHPVGMIATNAMASLATSGPYPRSNVELLWNTPLRTVERRYYDNCLSFFALPALSGRYRIGSPAE